MDAAGAPTISKDRFGVKKIEIRLQMVLFSFVLADFINLVQN
jgi:hypothetical protein